MKRSSLCRVVCLLVAAPLLTWMAAPVDTCLLPYDDRWVESIDPSLWQELSTEDSFGECGAASVCTVVKNAGRLGCLFWSGNGRNKRSATCGSSVFTKRGPPASPSTLSEAFVRSA